MHKQCRFKGDIFTIVLYHLFAELHLWTLFCNYALISIMSAFLCFNRKPYSCLVNILKVHAYFEYLYIMSIIIGGVIVVTSLITMGIKSVIHLFDNESRLNINKLVLPLFVLPTFVLLCYEMS